MECCNVQYVCMASRNPGESGWCRDDGAGGMNAKQVTGPRRTGHLGGGRGEERGQSHYLNVLGPQTHARVRVNMLFFIGEDGTNLLIEFWSRSGLPPGPPAEC